MGHPPFEPITAFLHLQVCDQLDVLGHRPVIVKKAVIGSNGGWKLSTIFLSCKVFHDWSKIKIGNILYLLDGYIFAEVLN